ncbi:hypothetical protein CJF42_02145 [Pseudoalteromonas sp. NBT06-2]|uniref:START domain-containing protein n=1 Tax=Pseudoalteromonas sp. NBT06-2 TaxID=2025950 RepID=UPI000BA5691C|nr:START domain-containing protein [Pseudoalteromonas sp. NBT06-2]PAJ76060.1 hypothetical protein CJF42_02145 [Pseudoalteromonas sp. NBT06-2]
MQFNYKTFGYFEFIALKYIKVKLKLLLMLSLLHINMANSAETWVLHKNESGIKVYKKVQPTGLVELKAQMQLKAKVSDFTTLLENTNNAPQWLDGVIYVKVLKRLSESENFVYSVFEAPWPVKNRDMLIYSQYNFKGDGSLVINMKTADRTLINDFKKNQDNIAITGVVASWQLTPITDNMLEITYIAYADPGGNLPNWLINKVALSSTYNTFKNLLQQLQFKTESIP